MSVLAKRTYKPADERREQILACALEVFAHKGYHGSSIADVCARAGIGRATLYQYFEDKRDLLVALADRIERRVADALVARRPLDVTGGVVPTDEQAVAFVTHRFAQVLRAVFHDAATTRLVLRAGRGADGVVDQMLARLDATVLALIEADLRAAVGAGWLRPLDVELVARFFLGGAEKVVLTYLDEGRPVDVDAIAHESALVQLFGTMARPAPPAPVPTREVPPKSPKARRKS
jgi:AcrR family transcriptional regulator